MYVGKVVRCKEKAEERKEGEKRRNGKLVTWR